jgi:hypothetical protein
MASQSTTRVFPGFNRCFWFTEPGLHRGFRADVELSVKAAFSITRKECSSNNVVIARWQMGATSPSDVIWTSIAAPLLVSDRVVEILRKLGATGWSTYGVALVGKRGERIGGFHGLAVHGRCGPIDNSKSVEVQRQFPGGLMSMWRGLYFEPSTWDGSHLFMPAGKGGWIFVVNEIRVALEKARIKHIKFMSLEGIERTDVEMSKPLTQ